jgi:CRP-like cAMP-binding protein
VLREWIVNVSRRSADQAIAHLFCELLVRLEAVGLRVANGFEFPVTQSELADTVGLSAVHVNRVLQELRARNLIVLNTHERALHEGHFDLGDIYDRDGPRQRAFYQQGATELL